MFLSQGFLQGIYRRLSDTDGGVSGFVGFALNQKGHSFFS